MADTTAVSGPTEAWACRLYRWLRTGRTFTIPPESDTWWARQEKGLRDVELQAVRVLLDLGVIETTVGDDATVYVHLAERGGR